jgi:hypothetical protein
MVNKLLASQCPASASAEKAQDSEQDDSSEKGRNQRPDYAAAQMQTKRPAKPTSYEGSDNSHDDVDHDAEATAIDDTTGQRASDTSDNQPENDSMRDRVHNFFLL